MKTVEFGKKIVITVITVVLLALITTIISTVVNVQADEKVSSTFFGLVRFAVTGSILYYLYAGNKVAKWLIVIITLIGGITGFLASLLTSLLAFNRTLIAINIMNMALDIIYIAIGVVLIVSSPVNDFLKYQRGEYKEENNEYINQN